MSNVTALFPKGSSPETRSHSAIRRLQGISELLAVMSVPNLRTHEDLLRAVGVLDLANISIKVVLSDCEADPATDHLRRLAEQLVTSVDLVRETLMSLPTDAPCKECAPA